MMFMGLLSLNIEGLYFHHKYVPHAHEKLHLSLFRGPLHVFLMLWCWVRGWSSNTVMYNFCFLPFHIYNALYMVPYSIGDVQNDIRVFTH